MSDYRYTTTRWRRMRKAQLVKEPFCRFCAQGICSHETKRVNATYLGKPIVCKTFATIADHVVAHKGDAKLFWDTENLQSLCKLCHDSIKQSMERNNKPAIGIDGWPV